MSTIVVLFALGALMLLLEIFLPGGVLGVLGAIAMIVGSVMAFRDYGIAGGSLAVLIGVVLVGTGLILEFVVLPRTRWGRGFFLSTSISGQSSAPAPASVIGRECEAITALAPSGMVLLDGRKYEAFSRDGFVERGARLVVRDADNFRLIVSKS